MDPKFIDEMARRLAGSVPEGVQGLVQDLESNFKAVLQSGLGKLDLVTREEFDVQVGVLRKSRAILKEYEARISELEQALAQKPAGD